MTTPSNSCCATVHGAEVMTGISRQPEADSLLQNLSYANNFLTSMLKYKLPCPMSRCKCKDANNIITASTRKDILNGLNLTYNAAANGIARQPEAQDKIIRAFIESFYQTYYSLVCCREGNELPVSSELLAMVLPNLGNPNLVKILKKYPGFAELEPLVMANGVKFPPEYICSDLVVVIANLLNSAREEITGLFG